MKLMSISCGVLFIIGFFTQYSATMMPKWAVEMWPSYNAMFTVVTLNFACTFWILSKIKKLKK